MSTTSVATAVGCHTVLETRPQQLTTPDYSRLSVWQNIEPGMGKGAPGVYCVCVKILGKPLCMTFSMPDGFMYIYT